MAFSIRTRTVVTPRPTPTIGGKPFVTAVSNSVAAIATAIAGVWTGPRQTFAYQWASGASTILNFTNASASIQSAGTLRCTVTVTNPYGSRAVVATGITVL